MERQRWGETDRDEKGLRAWRGQQAGHGSPGALGGRRWWEFGVSLALSRRVETTWTPTTCSAAASAPAAASRATRCPHTAPGGSAGPWRNSPWMVRFHCLGGPPSWLLQRQVPTALGTPFSKSWEVSEVAGELSKFGGSESWIVQRLRYLLPLHAVDLV